MSAAGWFEQDDGQLRYWDGEQWTKRSAPGRPRHWLILPLMSVVAFVFFIAGAYTNSTAPGGQPFFQFWWVVPVAAAPVVPAPVVPMAPAVEVPTPFESSCDVAREALLTGSFADIDSAMEALIADRTAPAKAREYANHYQVRDLDNKQLQQMDVSLIQMACSA